MKEEWKINKALYEGSGDDYVETPLDESGSTLEERKAKALAHPLPYIDPDASATEPDTYNRVVCMLTFNKASGALVGAMAKEGGGRIELDTTLFDYKTVNIDLNSEMWVGDYKTGSILPKVFTPIKIDEYTVDAWCHNRIQRTYKYYDQLNIVRKTLMALVTKTGLTASDDSIVDDLDDLDEFIAKMLENNEKYKAEYAASPAFNYLTKEEYDKEEAAQRAGALESILAPLKTVNITHKWASTSE